jgi:uncharacterized protein
MRVVLAHGASGSSASMQPHVEGLRARGLDAHAIDLPVRRAEAAVDAYAVAVARLPAAPDAGDARLAIGGHSYGGRVASLLAAGSDGEGSAGVACSALVLLSYPLHRPGQPAWEERSAHWPGIRVPVLLLSGESDPFARVDLLRRAVGERLPGARLLTWPRLGHGLGPVLDEALDAVASFLADVASA